MRKNYFIILIFFFNVELALSQVNNIYTGFIPVVNNTNFDIYNTFGNPALDNSDHNVLSLMISPSIHGIESLNSISLFSSIKIGDFKPGILVSGIFNELFNENSISANLSYLLSDKLTLGSRISYNLIGVNNYSTESYISLDIGGIVSFGNELKTGFMLSNINGGSYTSNSENIFRTAAFAFGGNLDERFSGEFAVIIRNYDSSGLMLSAAYKVINNFLNLGIGYLTSPQTFQLNIGIETFDGFNLLLTINHQRQLGYNENYGILMLW